MRVIEMTLLCSFLLALDSQEQELWMTQLQLCSRCLLDGSSKVHTQTPTHTPH
uniref:Uncharacterized protein n=1 Tax=Amphilophus citrinellus TaxID=61819 RepID=A0A3Q0T6G4_AMPCI